jgi:hypothetical protein
MPSVLYPVLEEAPPFGPDDVLGETAYFGPFEADYSTITQIRLERPTVMMFHVPLAGGGKAATAARKAIARGVWTCGDLVSAAGSRDAVDDYLAQLIEYAHYVRACREHGWESFHETPWTAAGTVLSYAPDEAVPERPIEVLISSRDRLHLRGGDDVERYLNFRNGFAAALAIHAIGGVDGMAVRQELWGA